MADSGVLISRVTRNTLKMTNFVPYFLLYFPLWVIGIMFTGPTDRKQRFDWFRETTLLRRSCYQFYLKPIFFATYQTFEILNIFPNDFENEWKWFYCQNLEIDESETGDK